MMNMTRGEFLSALGSGSAVAAVAGCVVVPGGVESHPKIALQLYSIHKYIANTKRAGGGVDLAKVLERVSAIGYEGVEFAGHYDLPAKDIRSALNDAGLVACGAHVGLDDLSPEKLGATCEDNLLCGNNLLICPGGKTRPDGLDRWTGWNNVTTLMTAEQEEYVKWLCDYYNDAAAKAAKYGCRVGLHNHTWEFAALFRDGTTYWDYFFSHTGPDVCMEQDVGWTTCVGCDPLEQFEKYPFRSPTIHAKENGVGCPDFEGILGRPGFTRDGEPVRGVDWDGLIPATRRNGTRWFVVECEAHFDDLTAILHSCDFLRMKGLGS